MKTGLEWLTGERPVDSEVAASMASTILDLRKRNAKLVAILEEVIPLLEEQGYKPEAKRARKAIAQQSTEKP